MNNPAVPEPRPSAAASSSDPNPVPVTAVPVTKGTAPGAKRKRRSGKGFALAMAGVVLLGGGIWLGTVVSDPTASEEYAALEATAQTAAADRDRNVEDLAAVSGELAQLKNELTTREAAADAKATAAGKHEADVKTAEAALTAREAGIQKREEAVTGAEATKAKNTFGDGTRTVGTDIEPGTYRTTADAGATCYWGIYATGSNGDDIIANDIPGGGRPTVVLSAGQDFNSARCGTWTKQ